MVKIAVYTIAKDEEQFVERWYESAKDADYLLIADTGSTDRTVELAKQLGINVIRISISPWRFDDARNAALAAIPNDIDMCVSLDMDEIITPGWRKEVEKAWKDGVTRPKYKHVWSWKPDGTPGLEFGYDHIHARKGYRWKHPVHEALYPYGMDEKLGWMDGLETHHHPDPTKSRSQYLPLLELSVREDPYNDRNAFYFARELYFYGQMDRAAQEFKRHLALPTAQWGAERAAACRFLAKCDPANKEAHLKNSIAEDSGRREAYVDLAMYYYENRRWDECYATASSALQFTVKPLDYLCEEFAWGYLPHDLASIAAWHLGNKDIAIEHEKMALSFEPNDIRMQGNLAAMLREQYPDKITAVIPTKSNVKGTLAVIDVLEADPQVLEIVVVLDGDNAAELYQDVLKTRLKVSSFKVDEGSGIHVMWNVGLEQARKLGTPVALINDDLIPAVNSVGALAAILAYDPTIGLVCPSYENRPFTDALVEDVTNARGAYDNTTGIAGCFMALSKPIVDEFNFDETMKWYYGDDDIVKWCNSKGYRTSIASITSFEGNESFTTVNDPPENFYEDTARDREIYESKWMS